MGVIHDCQPIQMGTPASRTVCSECGHDDDCTIHGGTVACGGWRTPCIPDTGLRVVE